MPGFGGFSLSFDALPTEWVHLMPPPSDMYVFPSSPGTADLWGQFQQGASATSRLALGGTECAHASAIPDGMVEGGLGEFLPCEAGKQISQAPVQAPLFGLTSKACEPASLVLFKWNSFNNLVVVYNRKVWQN